MGLFDNDPLMKNAKEKKIKRIFFFIFDFYYIDHEIMFGPGKYKEKKKNVKKNNFFIFSYLIKYFKEN